MKKKIFTLLAAIISCMPLLAQSDTINGYEFPEWNEYDITLTGNFTAESTSLSAGAENKLLLATFEVDKAATFSFRINYSSAMSYTSSMNISHNETSLISLNDKQVESGSYYYMELSPGKHRIQFTGKYVQITNIGIENSEQISVNLLEPGSLGTEVLYHVNSLKDVRNLKIKGTMNDADWATIDMMSLFSLDLSETTVTEISDNRFDGSTNLHTIVLPEGLTRIGKYAFRASSIRNINFPSTLQRIETYAFYNTCLSSVTLPSKCTSLGSSCFGNCPFLTELQLPEGITSIPSSFASHSHNLKSINLPNTIKSIGSYAFSQCYHICPDLPESLTSIGTDAFYLTNQYGEKTHLIIPKNVSNISASAFESSQYTYVELPSAYIETTSTFLPNTITTIRINCPTVLEYSSNLIDGISSYYQNITLQVPSYLVNSYKLDAHWYNYKAIEGFSTDEVDEWVISRDLVLGARDRMLGTPSIKINGTGGLKINGEDAMPINNLYCECTPADNSESSRIFSNADGVTIEGDLSINFNLEKTGLWYYISLPYDIKVSDISKGAALCAVRYYDGASRATNGASGNWKNYNADDIIPAGTGFIVQVNETGWWNFPAQENASKQYITSNKMFVRELAENPSENAADRGWNLVGNPYQSWYNIHKLNFTAPITVRNISNNTYAAYSIIDDDYAIAPNQAFFVQRPAEITNISFPLDGRQLTSVIEDQNNAKEREGMAAERLLTDIVVSDGTESDRTRVVLNDAATALYDMGSDANKFMADNKSVPQIYTIDEEGNMYSINERPLEDGTVKLGFHCGHSGAFTLSLSRNMAGDVFLTDHETGVRVNLAEQDYCFTAEEGTRSNRFDLVFGDGATNINGATNAEITVVADENGISVKNANGSAEVYNAGGVKVAEVENGNNVALPAGVYIVKSAGQVKKVVVK